jgi:hypothetical protein
MDSRFAIGARGSRQTYPYDRRHEPVRRGWHGSSQDAYQHSWNGGQSYVFSPAIKSAPQVWPRMPRGEDVTIFNGNLKVALQYPRGNEQNPEGAVDQDNFLNGNLYWVAPGHLTQSVADYYSNRAESTGSNSPICLANLHDARLLNTGCWPWETSEAEFTVYVMNAKSQGARLLNAGNAGMNLDFLTHYSLNC